MCHFISGGEQPGVGVVHSLLDPSVCFLNVLSNSTIPPFGTKQNAHAKYRRGRPEADLCFGKSEFSKDGNKDVGPLQHPAWQTGPWLRCPQAGSGQPSLNRTELP